MKRSAILYEDYLKSCTSYANASGEVRLAEDGIDVLATSTGEFEFFSEKQHGLYSVKWSEGLTIEEVKNECAVKYFDEVLRFHMRFSESLIEDDVNGQGHLYTARDLADLMLKLILEFKSIPPSHLVYTGSEKAQEIGVSTSRIRQLMLEGELSGRKSRGGWLIDRRGPL